MMAQTSASASTATSSSVPSSTSALISDLAPFVASVLKDRTVADLMTEIEELKKEAQRKDDERLRVEITGPHGSPVYYQASMKDGYAMPPVDSSDDFWVPFDAQNHNHTTVLNLAATIEGLEVRLGGVLVFKFSHTVMTTASVASHMNGFDQEHLDIPQMGNIFFRNDGHPELLYDDYAVSMLRGKIGPLLYDEYDALSSQMSRSHWAVTAVPDVVNNVINTNRNNNNNPQLLQDLVITGVQFQKSNILGIISLMETLGIATTGERRSNNSTTNS